MVKVLFVCLGNICRSPMAEFIFKDLAKKEGLEKFVIARSAGTTYETTGQDMHEEAKLKLNEKVFRIEGIEREGCKKEIIQILII